MNGSKGIGYKAVVAIAFLVIFTIFVFQNTEVVTITFLFWRFSISRVLVLLLSLAVGCLVGIFVGWEIFRRRKAP